MEMCWEEEESAGGGRMPTPKEGKLASNYSICTYKDLLKLSIFLQNDDVQG
jgi:hypothetical protein